MEKFKEFEINGQNLIFGGNIVQTCWEDEHNSGCDEYNTVTRKIEYLECPA